MKTKSPYSLLVFIILTLFGSSCLKDKKVEMSEETKTAISSIDSSYQIFLANPEEYRLADTAKLSHAMQIIAASASKTNTAYVRGLLLRSGLEYTEERYSTAIKLLQEADSLFSDNSLSQENFLRALVYNQQGLNYMYAKRYYSALNCINNNISICKNHNFDEMLLGEYANKGDLFMKMGRTREAIAASEKALSLYEKMNDKGKTVIRSGFAINNNLAIALKQEALYLLTEGRTDEANVLLEKADKILRFVIQEGSLSLSQQGKQNLKISKINLAAVHSLTQNQEYIKESIENLENLDSINFVVKAVKYSYLAALELKRNNFEKVNTYIDSSLFLFNYDLEQQDLSSAMQSVPLSLRERVIQCMNTRGLMYFEKYKQDGNSADLKKSINYYRRTIESINNLGIEIKDIARVKSLRSLFIRTYQEAVIVAKNLHEATGETKYLEESFRIKAEGNAFTLRQQIQGKVNEKNYLGKELEILRKDTEQRKVITDLQSRYAQSYDSEEKEKISGELTQNLTERRAFLQALENSRDAKERKYHGSRYNTVIPTIEDLQTNFLTDSTAIVNYFSNDIASFAFVLTKEEFFTVDLPSANETVKHSDNLQQQIKLEGAGSGFKEDAYILYQTYLEKIVDKLPKVKHFIIVPNNQMHGIAFGAFLRENPEHLDLHEYPFLIKDYYFSYVYSLDAQYLFKKLYENKEDAVGKLGVFVADYSDKNQKENKGLENENLRCSEEALPALRNVAIEVIPEYFNRNYQLFESATETDFTTNSANFDFLHLSMHGCTETDDPLNYSLVFTEGELTVGEIYSVHIPAKLTVIASCSANSGPIQRGEGLATISRAFNIAGCPNLVTTLNEIPDKETALLLEYFYFYLIKQQQQPAIALANAKRKFIAEKNNPANLLFWANVIAVGNAN